MPIQREIPKSFVAGATGSNRDKVSGHTPSYAVDRSRAMTPIEALLTARPFDEPELSKLELLAIRDAIEDAIDTVLDDQERWVFNAIVVERMSFRHLGKQLGASKSSIVRTRNRAVRKLRAALQDHPAIQGHLDV